PGRRDPQTASQPARRGAPAVPSGSPAEFPCFTEGPMSARGPHAAAASPGETMNTPTSQDVQTKPRKEEILEVATSLFAERGYDGTSMNDVAERVGMRKASLFYHFATKDALYEAVLDRLIESLGSALSAIYAGEGTFAERVERAADATTKVL